MTATLCAKMMNLQNKIKKFPIVDYQKLNIVIRKYKKKNKIIYNKKQQAGKAIFHVGINSFYTSCEEIRNPSLKGKPHAVIMTNQNNNTITKGQQLHVLMKPKKLGVQSAMSLYKALEICPNLI